MKVGNLYPQGDFKADCFVKVFETTLSSPTTTVTISNLDGNTNEVYLLVVKMIGNYAGRTSLRLRPNNDSGTNYSYQRMQGVDSTAQALRDTGVSFIVVGSCDASDERSWSRSILYAKSGQDRTCFVNLAYSIKGTLVPILFPIFYVWDNNADNIISLTLTAQNANGLGTGSYIALYQKVDKS